MRGTSFALQVVFLLSGAFKVAVPFQVDLFLDAKFAPSELSLSIGD